MKKSIIFFIILALFISVSAVHAEGNFTDLQTDIDCAEDSIELKQDYIYDDSSDNELKEGILIKKDNFLIDGKGHTVNGMGQARIFNITANNVTISDINLIRGYNEIDGGAIYCEKPLTLDGVNFKDNYAYDGGAVKSDRITIRNCIFNNNSAYHGALYYKWATIENTNFTNSHDLTFSMVYTSSDKELIIDHCSFSDSTAKYATAIYSAGLVTVRNTIFSNLHANESGSAIIFRNNYMATFENCTFSNTTSAKNGGAIYINRGTLKISNSSFKNCHGDMGGALVHLDGVLDLYNCSFTENAAIYNGGAIYVSSTLAKIENVTVESNEIYVESVFNGGRNLY